MIISPGSGVLISTAIQKTTFTWKNVSRSDKMPCSCKTDFGSIPCELSPRKGEISAMVGRVQTGSQGDEMDDAIFHQTCGVVGETSGTKYRRKAVLRIEASGHVARISHTGIVRMPTVRSYLSLEIVVLCYQRLEIDLDRTAELIFNHVFCSSPVGCSRSNAPNAVGCVYDELPM